MIIKIKKEEVNALKYACAVSDFKVEIYTMETNELTVAAEITIPFNAPEDRSSMAFYLGRMFETRLSQEELLRK